MELFDLTMPLQPGMPVCSDDPPLRVKRAATCDAQGYEVTEVCLGSHTGTHVEAPRHFFPKGKTLDEFPLCRFVGPGVIYDCRTGADETLFDCLARQLRVHPLTEVGIALLLVGGVPLTPPAAELLVGAGAGLVAVDSESVDEAPYPVHRYLLQEEVLIAENLVNLDRVGTGPVNCCLLPLALTGVEAAPARALVWRHS